MTDRTKYYATYTDDFGTTAIIIENDFENLYTEIDDVKFIGSEFSSMAVMDKSSYTKKQLERFTFFSTPILNTDNIEETLCNCSFKFSIRQTIIDKIKNIEIDNALTIDYKLGKERPKPEGGLEFEKVKLSLSIHQFEFEGTGDFFETAFDQIQKQFDDKYYFKNCYGCMYGDYSYAGQSSFGTMHCYVNQKDDYLKVRNKIDYASLSTDFKQVQEIYCCDKYEIRKKGTGYRG